MPGRRAVRRGSSGPGGEVRQGRPQTRSDGPLPRPAGRDRGARRRRDRCGARVPEGVDRHPQQRPRLHRQLRVVLLHQDRPAGDLLLLLHLGLLSNGFATCEDPEGLQAICDRLGPAQIQEYFTRWSTWLPMPLDAADRSGGYWWELSMRQVETSRTLVFDAPRRARGFFTALAPRTSTSAAPITSS